MITVTVWKENGEFRKIESTGHAGFAEQGRDIICAAVSALMVNTVNSIDTFTEDIIHVTSEDGYLFWEFIVGPGEASRLLMDSLMLGLFQIQESYENEYLKIIAKEV
ncbi:MAG: ribosomal-processing cysteine protease Prp [Lachnospiraceae bacterium]|nr:ribosomal-processing cysteine protease Prp [Lachnospiraceae bacterium]